MKRKSCLLLLMLLVLVMVITACGGEETGGKEEESVEEVSKGDLPEINMCWGNDLHTALPYLAIEKQDDFKDRSARLEVLSDNKFKLISEGEDVAIINFVAVKGGSEVATLMGQGHLDCALTSNTAMLTAIDKGTDIKILSPLQTGGMSMVFNKDYDIYGWDSVVESIESKEGIFKLGYHSPVSGPRILIESVLEENGFIVTEDPNDIEADVLLVDLKGLTNLLPSLPGGHVDGWVGPTLNPELAEQQDVGKIVLNLEDFPPQGKWTNFPCCIVAATNEVLEDKPEVIKAMVNLIDECVDYAENNLDDMAEVFAERVGAEEETVKLSTIFYTTNPDQDWLDGIEVYVDALNKMDKFNGSLEGMTFDEIKESVFDFTFIEEIRAGK